MIPDGNVFGALLGDRIRGDEDGTLVIAGDGGWRKFVADLFQQLAYPDDLSRAIAQRHVLGFSGRVCNRVLSMRCPTDKP